MKKMDKEGKSWGHGQYANMPQEVKMNAYPKTPYHADERLNDTASRIQEDDKQAGKAFRRSLDRGMY